MGTHSLRIAYIYKHVRRPIKPKHKNIYKHNFTVANPHSIANMYVSNNWIQFRSQFKMSLEQREREHKVRQRTLGEGWVRRAWESDGVTQTQWIFSPIKCVISKCWILARPDVLVHGWHLRRSSALLKQRYICKIQLLPLVSVENSRTYCLWWCFIHRSKFVPGDVFCSEFSVVFEMQRVRGDTFCSILYRQIVHAWIN